MNNSSEKKDKKKYFIKTQKYLSLFKDNLSLIVLVPTILGGLWQLIELSNISLSYIRFFSITQLISDGLLILVILILLSIYPYITYRGTMSAVKDIDSIKSKKIHVIVSVFIFVLSTIAFCLATKYFYDFIFKDKGENILFGLILFLPSVILITESSINIIFRINKFLEDKTDSSKTLKIKSVKFIKKAIDGFVPIIFLFSFFITIYMFFSFVIYQRNMHLLPKNNQNLQLIENIVSESYHLNYNDYEIVYFNDKYIFLEDNKNDKVLVLKFEDLFAK